MGNNLKVKRWSSEVLGELKTRPVRSVYHDSNLLSTLTCAAGISFFAIHHIDMSGLAKCLDEWCRVLAAGGHLFLAAWEGSGNVDYGDASDVVARRYTEREVVDAVSLAGLRLVRHSVEPVDEMDMDAVHLVASKPPR